MNWKALGKVILVFIVIVIVGIIWTALVWLADEKEIYWPVAIVSATVITGTAILLYKQFSQDK